MSKKKEWNYPIWMQVGNDKLVTQLYQVGVYGIINNDPKLQNTYHPKDLENMYKKFKNREDFTCGRMITVTLNEINLFEEILTDVA